MPGPRLHPNTHTTPWTRSRCRTLKDPRYPQYSQPPCSWVLPARGPPRTVACAPRCYDRVGLQRGGSRAKGVGSGRGKGSAPVPGPSQVAKKIHNLRLTPAVVEGLITDAQRHGWGEVCGRGCG